MKPLPPDFPYMKAYLAGRPQHTFGDPFSLRHPPMTTGHRAKIFAPFAALEGFGGCISAKDVDYTEKIDLPEEDMEALRRTLALLKERCPDSRQVRLHPVSISVTYYVPCTDENRFDYAMLGSYRTVTGVCWGVDDVITKTIRVGDLKIPLADVLGVEVNNGNLQADGAIPNR